MPGAVPRPRHMRHHHAVLGAADPRRVCLHEHTDRARIQRPPATPSLTGVVAATPPTADTAPASRRPRSPHPHDQLTAAVPSNSTPSTTVFSTPNKVRHTLALRTPFPVHRS